MSEIKYINDVFMKDPRVIEFKETLRSLELEFDFKTDKCYKNATKSEEIRKIGNTKFNKQDIFGAIKLYTESIAYGPFNSDALAKSYGNRSAALIDGGLYKECIEDINNAYQHGYSKTDEKLLIRLALCQFVLNEETELSNTIKSILSVSKKYKDEHEIIEELKLKPRKEPFVTCWFREPPPLSYGPNEEFPCASSAVKIAFDNINGQHLVATRDINTGDVLVVEKPYSFYLFEIARYYHCSHCMKFCLTLIPCENCVWAMFCSKECKIKAENENHMLECIILPKYWEASISLQSISSKYFRPNQENDAIYAVIRCLCKAGLDNIKNQINIIHNAKKVGQTRTDGFVNGIYDPANIEAVLHFPAELFDGFSKNTLFCYAIKGMLIEKCFNTNMEFDYNGFIALFLKLYFSLSRKSFLGGDKFLENSKYEFFAGEICSSSSLMHHSCCQNSITVNYGDMTVTVALLPVKKGGLITTTSTACTNDKILVNRDKDFGICHCEACLLKINVRDFNRPSKISILYKVWLVHLQNKMIEAYETAKLCPNEESFMEVINSVIQEYTDVINEHYHLFQFDPLLIRAYDRLRDCLSIRSNLVLFKK